MATTQRPRARLSTELPPERRWTADEVRDLVEERRPWPRFECARGRLLVTPAPLDLHQVIVTRLAAALLVYCEAHFDASIAMVSPSDISWGHRDTTLQPDVFVVPRAMLQAAARLESSTERWKEIRHLLLAAEVVSPSTASYDRADKRLVYQAEGTPVYWVLDWRAGVAEEWTPDAPVARVERERLTWHPEGADAPFELALAHLYRPL